jgi:hypothetical protein
MQEQEQTQIPFGNDKRRQEQTQIPFGNDKKSKTNAGPSTSLRFAQDDTGFDGRGKPWPVAA